MDNTPFSTTQPGHSTVTERKFLESLLNAMPQPVIVTKIADGTVLYANPQLSALFGLPLNQIIGMRTPDYYYHPADRLKFVQTLQREGHVRNAEIQLKRQDGVPFWAEITIELTSYQDAPTTIAIIEDISARKELEQRASQSLARRGEQISVTTAVAQQIASATQLDQLFTNIVTLTKEQFGYYHTQLLRYDIQKDAVMLVAGYGEIGKKMLSLGHQLPMGRGLIGTAAATGQTILRSDLSMADPDWQPNPLLPETRGEIAVPIKWQNEILGVLDVQSDQVNVLTDEDRLLLEGLCGQIAIAIHNARLVSELQTSRERFELAVAGSNDGLWDWDMATNAVYFSPRWKAMIGYGDGELEQGFVDFERLLHPEDHDWVLAYVNDYLTGKIPHYEIEFRFQHKDGSYRWILARGAVVRNPDGIPVRMAGSHTDISDRKQNEMELLLFRYAMEQSTDSIFITDTKGVISYVNPSFEKVYGYPASEAIGQTPRILKSGLIPQDQYTHFWNTLLNKGIVAGEIINKAKDGRLIPVEGSNTPILDSTGKIIGFMAIHRDITERKEAMQRIEALVAERTAQLRESEAQLRSILDSLPMGMHIYHLEEDGRLVFTGANPAADKLLGVENSIFIGKTIEENFPALVETEVPERYRQVAAEGLAWQNQQITYDEGNIQGAFDVYAFQTTPNHMVAAFLDITDRMKANAELLRLQSAVEQSAEGIAIADTDGKILYANPAWAGMHGYTVQEILSKHLSLFHTAEQIQNEVMPLNTAAFERGTSSGEVGHVHRDGHTFPTLMSATVLKDTQGASIGLVGTARDITESKQVERELAEQRIFLRQVIDANPNLIFVKDRNSRFVLVNQALANLYHTTVEDLVGKSDADFNSNPEEVEKFHIDDLEVIDGKQHKFIPEEPISEADGSLRWLQTIKVPLVDEAGEAQRLLGVAMDITERKNLEMQVEGLLERRGYQVQLSTEISQEIASAPELETLFERVVTLVKERLGYYHTQLLRYEPSLSAMVLVAGYGAAGEKMLADGHQIPLGRGLIGRAAASGQAILRPTLVDDPDWQPNPLLPETQGEIAAPIKLGQQILGVLDVQSSQAGILTSDDQLLLEGLCGQIAIAMEQTRLRQEMQERLEEINLLYRSMSREGWNAFRSAGELPAGFQFDPSGTHPLMGTSITSSSGIEAGASPSLTSVPLTIPGGTSIGMLGIVDDPERPMTPEDQTFLQQISEQVALALESARLFAQTQSTLAQTETLYAGSERVIRSNTLNEVLAAAIETSALNRFERASILLFDQIWDMQPPESGIIAGQWARDGIMPVVPLGSVFPIRQLSFSAQMRRDASMHLHDTQNDVRLDPQTRNLLAGIGKSISFFPLVAGDQWFGFIVTAANETVHLTTDSLRQVESLVGQSAAVVQSIRLYEQAQATAQRERILREVTTKVRTSVDADTILRTAVRELGQALGRETFVRVGGAASPSTDPLSQANHLEEQR